MAQAYKTKQILKQKFFNQHNVQNDEIQRKIII